jgi:isoleucyl-tRNA synthetase
MTKNQKFQPTQAQVNFPDLEEKIIAYWKENRIFEKSVEQRPLNKAWTFLDGPPFITGLPHYGTLLSSIPKDLFPRFWTMKGYRVRRVWGWDCHGLPAENKVEKKLGIKRKKDIINKIGVKKFIDECKMYVKDVSSEWEWYVDHIGRWVDFQNAYKTMDKPYMETVMWVFKKMYEKNLIYKGLRVSLYCPHDVTPISNFEVAMDADNYKEITEPTAVFKYQSSEDKDTYFLAWSTTPWNKLATPALAVNPTLIYVKVKQDKEIYILAKSTLKMLNDHPYTILGEFPGSQLVGKKFIPHYDYYKIESGKNAFVVIPGDFVTSDEGTGIVTIAAYGEEDLAVMQKENIQIIQHIDEEGVLKKEVPKWGGMYYLDADPLIIEDLTNRGLIYRVDKYTHTVPTCWRCHTRLIYAPQDAWYVNVQKLKLKLKETNEKVNWYPVHFKYGRYLKSLENAPDWCISRSRFWGSPVPVWECPDGHRFVPGSISELEKASGKKISDLHKPVIDDVTVKCETCGKDAKRVTEVLDSWIEAGSASFAERHFPFDTSYNLSDFFPPDFITEYTGQIRAWFYVLHVIATALNDTNAFKNVLVSGVILGTDGRKMSKNYGNYPDPKELIQKYGGDALRLYLLGSPVMHGEDIRISELDYRNQVKGLMLLLWNVYNFFITYANIDDWKPPSKLLESVNVMDKWILSRMNKSIGDITQLGYENYDTPEIVSQAYGFVRDLSMWYVRRIRDRVGPSVQNSLDKTDAYQTLWFVLTEYTKVLAPLMPFMTEEIFRNLTGLESVHLMNWPIPGKVDKLLLSDMELGRKIVERIHAARKEKGLKVRMPILAVSYRANHQMPFEIEQVIMTETNIKKLNYDNQKPQSELPEVDVDFTQTTELIQEGEIRELIRSIQILRKENGNRIDDEIKVEIPIQYKSYPQHLLDAVQKEALIKSYVWAKELKILTG